MMQSKYSTSQSGILTLSSARTGAAITISAPSLQAPWTRFGFLLGVTLSRLLDGAYRSFTPPASQADLFPTRFASHQSLRLLEGWRSEAYLDQGGVPTIGWGRTEGVRLGMVTTEAQERAWLDRELSEIDAHLRRIIKVKLTQGQYDALVLWAYNVGRAAVERSTLVRLLNTGQYSAVPSQLKRWVYVNGKVSRGLINRRLAEIAIWNR